MGRRKKIIMVYPIPQYCHQCRYYCKSIGCCDYISITGHSRTFNSKRKQIRYTQDGTEYCDKYEEGKEFEI